MSEIPSGFERVRCKCPPYRGSDFWNDPHRWCGIDPAHERFWEKAEADCERTVRPKPAPRVRPYDAFLNLGCAPNELQSALYWQNQMNSQGWLSQPWGRPHPLAGLFGFRLF